MNRRMVVGCAASAVVAVLAGAVDVRAQVVTVFHPMVQPVIVQPAPAPTVAFYAPPVAVAPTAHWVGSPVVVTAASPVVAPAPVVTYYRAPTVAYAPVQQVVTRRRPILGGTVSRVQTSFMPVVVP